MSTTKNSMDADNLRALIGEPMEGTHPDEWMPRATTWHRERLNWIKEVCQLRTIVERLSRFKAYVHARLDDAGIPTDPESRHKAEGCRIGGRLDIVLPAVNAHDDLVQACKAWMEVSGLLDVSASLLATPQGIQTLAIARLNARDALTKAEAK